MPTISLTEVKNCVLSKDGAEVHMTFATKYAGEYTLTMSLACRDRLLAALATAPASAAPNAPAESNQINVHVPKKWMVTADLKVHDVVLLLFDPQSEARKGFALSADSAKRMASRLVKSADAVQSHKEAKAAPAKQ